MTRAASLLLPEPPLVVLPSLARHVGLNEAIVLQQVYYRSLEARDDGWVQRTLGAWHGEFRFWSPATIKRAFASLREQGLIETEIVTTNDGRESKVRVVHDAVDALGGSGQNDPTGRITSSRPVGSERPDVEPLKEDRQLQERVSPTATPSPKKTPATQASSSSSRLAARRDAPEIVALCERLAARMTANDPNAKIAPGSKAWRDPIRLLLDADRRTVPEVELVIDWCQADEFWRSNVLSPAALRKQFPRLLLAARRGDHGAGGAVVAGGGGPRGGADDRARRLREQAAAERDVVDGSEAASA